MHLPIRFMCDDGHQWSILAPLGYEPTTAELTCSIDGTSAVTVAQGTPADRVIVSLLPLAIADGPSGRVHRERLFHVEIRSTVDTRQCRRSVQELDWDHAVRRAALFQEKTWSEALRQWERHKLGDASANFAADSVVEIRDSR